MIPMIGLMIGAYIITRSLSLALRLGDRKENIIVQFLAVLTVLVVLGVISYLFTSGESLGKALLKYR